ncbi:MAG: hypothetical protein ACREV1_02275 [Gammaproteobacteria bacterium]
MTAIAFDTLKFAKRLKEGGFTDQQAETLAQAEAEFIEQNLTTKRDLKDLEIALKRDIEELRGSVKRDIEELRADLKRDLKELEYRMTIKLGAMLAVAAGAMAALVKLL